jgi:hypothetical protein
MEMFFDFGYVNNLSPMACYLNGMVVMIMSAWLALNLERPKKQDY